MQALIDGIVFQNTYQKGIQRYWREVITRISTIENVGISLLMEERSAVSLPSRAEIVDRSDWVWHADESRVKRLARKVRRNICPRRIPFSNLFHSTYYTHSPVPGLPTVVTVYDMIPEAMPHFFAANADAEINKKRNCILTAQAIITISESTKADLMRVYPEVSDRITAIPLGVDHLHVETNALRETISQNEMPYVLFVGDRAGYKNFATLVEALCLREWDAEVGVVVVGKPFSEAERTWLHYRGVSEKIIHRGKVSDDELKEIYLAAKVFVFPSLMEGFGLPILEAQSLGVPIVASDIPAFHEIGGDAFVPFPALDALKLAEAVARVMDPMVSASLKEKAANNVRRFSWDRCAEETYKVWSTFLP